MLPFSFGGQKDSNIIMAGSVQTAASILNKGRKPPRVGITSVPDANAILNKTEQQKTHSGVVVDSGSDVPVTNEPDNNMPITDLVHVFEQNLKE